MATKSGMLPRQDWDEIGVSNDRVKVQPKQVVEVKVPKEVVKLLKSMKKGKKKNGR